MVGDGPYLFGKVLTGMEGSAMSHKKSPHQNSVEGLHLSDSEVETLDRRPSTVVPKPSTKNQDEVAVPVWGPLFVLGAIAFGLMILAAKAIGLL
jgi:hypothetical protein